MNLTLMVGERIIPNRIKSRLSEYILKTGNTGIPYAFFGLLFLLLAFLNLGISILFFFGGNGSLFFNLFMIFAMFVGLQILSIVILYLIFFVYYEIIIFNRTKKIEKVLPDFLNNVAVNLRAGMTFDKALWNSVEPEYGILEKEIEIVAKKVMSGEDIEEALIEFSNKYDSSILKESIDLIIIGIRSGGEISDLIDRIVKNVKDITFLKEELVANVMGYVIFITMIAVFIAPTLFALSYNLMVIMQSLGKKLSSTGSLTMAFDFGKEIITREQFITFSRWCIGMISVASSMIIADLREGNIKGGIKYLVFFIIGGLLIYEVMLLVFTGVFGGMMG